jgi:environmental stress-induced protein Ves
MRAIRIADLPAEPWRNGGGVTRELARSDDAGGLVWRLSVADVESDGPFSHFAGLFRVLTVIEGAGLALNYPGGLIAAGKGTPVHFRGDIPIDCRLVDGPVRDFNLIFDPRKIELDVIRLGPGAHRIAGVGILPLEGETSVNGFGAVSPASFLLFETDAPQDVRVSDAALAVTHGR